MSILPNALFEAAQQDIDGRFEAHSLPGAMFAGRNRAMDITLSEAQEIIITFDILLSESHGWSVKATTHPVEKGTPFTTNVQQQTRKGSMGGYISNFGLKRGELESNVAQEVFDIFESYKNNVEPVDIVTSLKLYKSYIITSVKEKRDGKTGEAQGFNIEFQEYRIVQLKEANIAASQIKRPNKEKLSKDDEAKRVSPNANAGQQQPVRFFSSPENSQFGEFFNPGGV